MIESAKKHEKKMMAVTILTLVIGIIITLNPGKTIEAITCAIAVIGMVLGIYKIIDYIIKSKQDKIMSVSLIVGTCLLIGGIVLFINRNLLADFFVVLIGVAVCIKAMFKIQFAFNLKGISSEWKKNLLTGLITLAVGVIMILLNGFTAGWIVRLVGIMIVAGSIAELIEIFSVIKTLSNSVEPVEKEEKVKEEKVKELEYTEKK